MTKRGTGRTGAILALAIGVGCGTSEVRMSGPAAAPTHVLADAPDAGVEPIASSPANALPETGAASDPSAPKALIKAQLYAHAKAVDKCLVDYLVKNDLGGGVAVDFAMGQEGTLVDVVVWGATERVNEFETVAERV